MADWTTELPGTAEAGKAGHPEDHNKIVAAIREARSFLDQLEAAALTSVAWGDVGGKPSTFAPAPHEHSADDITSGTLAAARIPTLSQGKVTGLTAALDSKADASVVEALEARVAALEPEG